MTIKNINPQCQWEENRRWQQPEDARQSRWVAIEWTGGSEIHTVAWGQQLESTDPSLYGSERGQWPWEVEQQQGNQEQEGLGGIERGTLRRVHLGDKWHTQRKVEVSALLLECWPPGSRTLSAIPVLAPRQEFGWLLFEKLMSPKELIREWTPRKTSPHKLWGRSVTDSLSPLHTEKGH